MKTEGLRNESRLPARRGAGVRALRLENPATLGPSDLYHSLLDGDPVFLPGTRPPGADS